MSGNNKGIFGPFRLLLLLSIIPLLSLPQTNLCAQDKTPAVKDIKPGAPGPMQQGPILPSRGPTLAQKISFMDLLATALYGFLGIVLSMMSYKIFDLTMPFSVNKEIEEDQNIALGLVLGAMCIGCSIIIAAAILS
ncbi:DUF350 domain-containing protein [Candidatus Riflebacteria bacterium]